jgi:LuxR family transcriptional regulator, maltose regulon positive regulatory protein
MALHSRACFLAFRFESGLVEKVWRMADFIPVTRTKIIVPRRRSDLLSRDRLLGLLDELLDNRLIILAAPAGYGKTSLMVDFAHSTPWPVCWYALDALDQDPYRFLAHFISALSLRFPSFGKSCMAALQSMSQDRMDLDLLASLIINDAYENITEHFIMVLDDFHLVETNPQVVHFINRFIQDVDENCHLVLASRVLLTLPDLPLMVARSQVGGLSFEELAFQTAEVQRLIEQNFQITLSENEAAHLAEDSEGWVTGLLLSTQLAGKSVANRLRVARVSGVGLYQYLAQQVLDQQAPDVQDFLLRTSLLDEFDVPLCESVICHALDLPPRCAELMEIVTRNNLFVLPVGDEGTYLRYHHLFQEFLRDRIHRVRPDEARRILQRLAEVYGQREDWERAYLIYRQLGDTEAIVHLVEQAGSAMIIQGRLLTLAEWLDSLPTELIARHPVLVSLQGAVAIMRGDSASGLRLLDQAVADMRRAGESHRLARVLYRRGVAYRLAGRYRDALADAEEALALLPSAAQYLVNPHNGAHEGAVIYADVLMNKATVLSYLGEMQPALTLLKESLAAYRALGDEQTTAKVWIEIGRVSRTLGRYGEAEEAFLKALAYYQVNGNLIWQANLYNSLGILQHARGDAVTATASFEKAIHYARAGGSARLEAYTLTSIGDLYQELDAFNETQEAYRQAREIAKSINDGYLRFYLDLMEARLKLTLSEPETAEALLHAAEGMATERGSRYEQNLVRLEWGRLKYEQDCIDEAENLITHALNFFLSEGCQIEIPRARLYAMLTLDSAGKYEQSAEQANCLTAMLSQTDERKLLTAAGRELKTGLARIQSARHLGTLPNTLLQQVEQHEQEIPNLRRAIRRHAAVVPFAPPKMIIRALGKVQVKVADQVITSSDWQVQTARDLFLLLLAHPEGLTKEQIGEIFWPDSTTGELKLRFKNTIYRLRHAAGKDAILFQGESLYLFNRFMDYEYDVEAFQKELAQAERAAPVERAEHYRAAVKLYRGPYMPDLDETWAIAERERLHLLFMDALLHLAQLALNARDTASCLEYCQQALKEEPCHEEAHRVAMRAYAAQGNRALVARQYEQCCQALLEDLDAPPSPQTQALYEQLIQ